MAVDSNFVREAFAQIQIPPSMYRTVQQRFDQVYEWLENGGKHDEYRSSPPLPNLLPPGWPFRSSGYQDKNCTTESTSTLKRKRKQDALKEENNPRSMDEFKTSEYIKNNREEYEFRSDQHRYASDDEDSNDDDMDDVDMEDGDKDEKYDGRDDHHGCVVISEDGGDDDNYSGHDEAAYHGKGKGDDGDYSGYDEIDDGDHGNSDDDDDDKLTLEDLHTESTKSVVMSTTEESRERPLDTVDEFMFYRPRQNRKTATAHKRLNVDKIWLATKKTPTDRKHMNEGDNMPVYLQRNLQHQGFQLHDLSETEAPEDYVYKSGVKKSRSDQHHRESYMTKPPGSSSGRRTKLLKVVDSSVIQVKKVEEERQEVHEMHDGIAAKDWNTGRQSGDKTQTAVVNKNIAVCKPRKRLSDVASTRNTDAVTLFTPIKGLAKKPRSIKRQRVENPRVIRNQAVRSVGKKNLVHSESLCVPDLFDSDTSNHCGGIWNRIVDENPR